MTTRRADNDIRLVMLDEFRLEYGDVVVRAPRSVQRLVAYLGLFPPRPRVLVSGTLWPDVSEQRAAGSLRSTVWRLQKLCPRMLTSHREDIALAPHVQVDVRDFMVAARQLLARSTDSVSVLPAQLVSWGELLPGWYEDWVLLERDRIRQLRLHALEELADQLARRGQFSLALEAALNAVNAEPLRESAHRSVARVHLAEGNPAEAVQRYETFRCLIGGELGLSPTQEFLHLIRNWPSREGSSKRGGGV